MAEQAQSISQTQRTRAERSAWLTLVLFFLVFCGLIAAGGVASWRYYTSAMMPLDDALLRVHVSAGVSYYPRSSINASAPRDRCQDGNDVCVPLKHEGDRIVAVRPAGYGQVASLLLQDQTHVQLWAHPTGADLTLKTYQGSRWTGRQENVVFQQSLGYARYDVRDGAPYAAVQYTVDITDGLEVQLEPGGSYSINVPRPTLALPRPADKLDARVLASLPSYMAEIAVTSGSATVRWAGQQVKLRPEEKIQISAKGVLGAPTAAVWNLIDVGSFARPEVKPLRIDRVWSAGGGPLDAFTDDDDPGAFRLRQGCPPAKVDFCDPQDQVAIGQFRREGNQRKSYQTVISQTLDEDVSEYTQSLNLVAWVRVLSQTVEAAGIDGTECPIMFTIRYKNTSPTDDENKKQTCLFTYRKLDKPNQKPWIEYRQLPSFVWYKMEIPLRKIKDLRDVRYLQDITIEARGHDYLSEITDISLIGKH